MGEIADLDAYRRRKLKVLGEGLSRQSFSGTTVPRHDDCLDRDIYPLSIDSGYDILNNRFADFAIYAYNHADRGKDSGTPESFNAYMKLLTGYVLRSIAALELHHRYRKGCRIGQYVALEEEKQAVEEMYLKLNEGF